MDAASTIAALITAPGVGAVTVVRVSGQKTKEIIEALCESAQKIIEEPRKAQFTAVRDLLSDAPLDHCLVIFFAGPNSYTGEDSAEFSLHGSSFILKRFLENLREIGVRDASAGEFTERAYLNGKLDLAQAEAVQDLILAETESQAKLAREQLEGRLSGAISELGSPLRELLAQIEAFIDFPEEDIEPLNYTEWSAVIAGISNTLERYIASYSTGRLQREGASIVLVGLPNVGKSSLLNALVGDERAIVTAIAGTTRDSIEERITLDGMFVRLWDTAGIAEQSDDVVEKIGIEQSWKRAKNADLILFLFDLQEPFEQQKELVKRVQSLGVKTLFVGTKSDLKPDFTLSKELAALEPVPISAKTGAGLDMLRQTIVSKLIGERQTSILIASERHVEALKRTYENLCEAQEGLSSKHPPEFISVTIRSALVALEEIVGVTTTDEILGMIFSKFCIGK